MKKVYITFLSVWPLAAQIGSVAVTGTTSTQALISYMAPDNGACTVQVSQNSTLTPLVHDVDPTLFAGSNLDSRPGALSNGRSRRFIVGTRSAPLASDGRRYSRALQALTQHYFTIACGSAQTTGTFTTSNIPLGGAYSEPVPVDRTAPGVTAWPGFYGRNRPDFVIDPQTGLKIMRAMMPQDSFGERDANPIYEAQDVSGGGWALSGCPDINTCVRNNDSAALVNSTGNPGYLFLSSRDTQNLFNAKSYDQALSYDWTRLNIKGSCSGASCASAAAADRTVSVCLTVNRVSCESSSIDQVLTTSQTQYAVGGTTPVLADWTGSPAKLNMVEMWPFNGTANVALGSTTVTWASGDLFSIWWTAGSVINLNGLNYTIASISTNQSLQLDTAWVGASGQVTYTANNTGFLIRKKTPSADAVSIQYATFDYSYSVIQPLDSSGIQQLYWTCSPVEQDLGGGKLGRLCATEQGFYAYESATGIHRSLGTPAIYVSGQYPSQGCPLSLSSAVFDAVNPNAVYCLAIDVNNRTALFQGIYYGNFNDIGPVNYSEVSLTQCNAGHTNQPCMAFTNLTPPPNNLEAQIAALNPAWQLAPAKSIEIGGRQGAQVGLWGNMGNQNSLGWVFTFDPVANAVSAASPTFASWPSRWAGIHSWNNTQDASYLRQAIGDLAIQGNPVENGPDQPGLGPFGANMLSWWNGSAWVSSATPASGQACPPRPAGSPIALSDWPTGNNCIEIQVDGETCDPSPGTFAQGTVSSGATLTDIVAAYGVWYPGLDGKPITINGVTYTFHFVTSSTGTISPAAGAAYSGKAYTILVENSINNAKCGNPGSFYMQDAAVRDVLMFTAGQPANWKTQNTEFMRLIVKTGTTWWMERGYKGHVSNTAWPVNTTMWQYQASCPFKIIEYEGCDVEWNFIADPLGRNLSGTTMLIDTTNWGGHTGSAFYPGFVGIDAKPYSLGAQDCVPMTDWKGFTQYPCYEVRQGGDPGYISSPIFFAGAMPTFAGVLGIGVPNGVDSHPTVNQISAPPSEQTWFFDARPMNGDDFMVGTQSVPGVNVAGSLWKFTLAARGCSTAALCTQQRKALPTLAGINRYPLLDISSAAKGNILGTGQNDWFKYCVAERAGECRAGSAVGDLYVNGPISTPYCSYPGIAVGGGAIFDPCIGPMSGFAENIVQYGIGTPGGHDWNATRSRALTHGLVRYRWLSPYWNVRTSNDGKWLFFRADWMDGVRSEWMIAAIPPYPQPDSINRADFIPVTVNVSPPAGATSVVAEFGYAENGSPTSYFCTSRQESCVKGNQPGNTFGFAGDNVPGLPCVGGCTISIPALSQHVMYYNLKYLNAAGVAVQVSETYAAILP